jgi:hypothetical protein
MQFDEYESLAKSWKERKEFLRSELDRIRGKQYIRKTRKNSVSFIEDLNIQIAQEERKREIEDQKRCLAEMALEDIYAKKFYKAEMIQCLRERR